MRAPWKIVVGVAFLTSLAALILSAVLFSYLSDTSHRADKDIFKSRIGSVDASCHKFNDIQATLSDLIRVSLQGPRQKNLTDGEKQAVTHIVARFRVDLKKLAPNDCADQRHKLYKALQGSHFERSVPYSP